jgi:pimeloyl-ACP methyl ester carboxylesterase
MLRKLRWTVSIGLVIVVLAYGLISFLITQGLTKADRNPQEDHPSNHGLAFEDVQFLPRGGGPLLSGWYIAGDPSKPNVIFVHGLGSKRSGDKAVGIAAGLVRRGYSALLFDLRGHGDSADGKISGGLFERLDVLGAFDYLRDHSVPSDRIGVLGFSMGAGTTVLAAGEEPALRAVVLDSPYAAARSFVSHEAARKTVFPEWLTPIFVPTSELMAATIYGISLSAMVPEEAVQRIDYPVLVIHGAADTRIPLSNGMRVHAAAHPGSELWLVPGVDHVDAFIDYPVEYIERVDRYFHGRLTVYQAPLQRRLVIPAIL